jgi:two-component system phosphate regulon response regulator PhoB
MSLDKRGAGPATVLLVDDEEDIVTYLVTLLQDSGYDAVGVSDADAALAAIDAAAPDLILLDIMMPGESGLSLYQKLRGSAKTADVPVLFISGLRQTEELGDLARGHEREVPDAAFYLEKPIRAEELIRRIREVLPWTQ